MWQMQVGQVLQQRLPGNALEEWSQVRMSKTTKTQGLFQGACEGGK
jgi:hypothetical protein